MRYAIFLLIAWNSMFAAKSQGGGADSAKFSHREVLGIALMMDEREEFRSLLSQSEEFANSLVEERNRIFNNSELLRANNSDLMRQVEILKEGKEDCEDQVGAMRKELRRANWNGIKKGIGGILIGAAAATAYWKVVQ